MLDLLLLLATTSVSLLPLAGPERFAASLDPMLLEKAQHLDVVSVGGKFSYAEYRDRAVPQARTDFPTHSLAPHPTPFGRYLIKNKRMFKTGPFCGYIIPLAPQSQTLNLLPFQELTVTGDFSGSWRLAFADATLAAVQDNVELGTLQGSGSHTFDLSPVLRTADLSRARNLILLLSSESGSAGISEVTFSHPQRQGAEEGRGIWVWRRDQVLGQEEAVVRRLSALGIRRVYLQVGDDPEVFAPFLAKAGAAGIEVYALDGSPQDVAAPEGVLARIGRVQAYNRDHVAARYAGFQIDIEPYLNKDFASRTGYYTSRYLELIDRIKEKYDLPLSVVVPFWFDTLHAGGSSLLQGVVARADEVVVMSYRTDPRAVLAISRSALSLGEMFAKPVRLGVELGPIPDEQHQEFGRCSRNSPGAVRLGSSWWCPAASYLVPGSTISFRSRIQELPSFLKTRIPFASFRGWVLHSYEELAGKHD